MTSHAGEAGCPRCLPASSSPAPSPQLHLLPRRILSRCVETCVGPQSRLGRELLPKFWLASLDSEWPVASRGPAPLGGVQGLQGCFGQNLILWSATVTHGQWRSCVPRCQPASERCLPTPQGHSGWPIPALWAHKGRYLPIPQAAFLSPSGGGGCIAKFPGPLPAAWTLCSFGASKTKTPPAAGLGEDEEEQAESFEEELPADSPL